MFQQRHTHMCVHVQVVQGSNFFVPAASRYQSDPMSGDGGHMDDISNRSRPGGKTPGNSRPKRGNSRPKRMRIGAHNILSHNCDGNVQTYRLADYLPQEWLESRGHRPPVFGPDSIAAHQVASRDLESRVSIIVSQTMARDVLNQALHVLSEGPKGSLHDAIYAARGRQIITHAQAKALLELNAAANDAKHGTWFEVPDVGGETPVVPSS